jgi:hypothetical protein
MTRRRTDDGDSGGATTAATWKRRSGRERIGGFKCALAIDRVRDDHSHSYATFEPPG